MEGGASVCVRVHLDRMASGSSSTGMGGNLTAATAAALGPAAGTAAAGPEVEDEAVAVEGLTTLISLTVGDEE